MNPFIAAREKITVNKNDPALAASLASELDIPFAAASVLAGRNFSSADACRKFFEPSLSHLNDPLLFPDMKKAVTRITAALSDKEKIAVHGDYDVDGVSGTALLMRVLRSMGADCDYYLPNRLTDGYGLSGSVVRQIVESGAKLLITVDCGITAIDETRQAQTSGVDVIITDHHEPKETLPPAFALINPKMRGSPYPDRDLAGVGVALKLCQALGTECGMSESLWEPYLDLAALGTAADIVPLTGENRTIARFGFERMRATANKGLAALMELQGLTGKPLSTSQVVFQLAPCINAAGRLGDPRRAVEMLLTEDAGTAQEYARELRNTNYERRTIDANVWQEVSKWVEKNCDIDKDFVIVMGSANWHPGVIGIVASKLVDRYHRPAILFSMGNDGMARGSGRSIPGLHLLDALYECGDLLETFGGHAAAAGMNIRSSSIDAFRARFNEVVRGRVTPADLVPVVTADTEVSLSSITPQLFSCIKSMEPFGPGNMRPLFYCRNLSNRFAPKIVGEKHLKLTMTGDGRAMEAIAFNFGDRIGEIKNAPSVSLAFSIEENEWNGRKSLQMNVKGFAL
jgi:single-stranded-DNA-specific exonuclease